MLKHHGSKAIPRIQVGTWAHPKLIGRSASKLQPCFGWSLPRSLQGAPGWRLVLFLVLLTSALLLIPWPLNGSAPSLAQISTPSSLTSTNALPLSSETAPSSKPGSGTLPRNYSPCTIGGPTVLPSSRSWPRPYVVAELTYPGWKLDSNHFSKVWTGGILNELDPDR